MPEPKHGSLPNTEMGLERLVFFSDAVMAIAITLLALDIRVPEMPRELAAAQLPGELAAMTPRYTSFVTSFVIIGVYWLSHHHYFEFIRRYDRRLILINLLFLLFIVSVPFVTNLLGLYATLPLVYIIYGVTVAAIGFAMCALWMYATHNHRLVDPKLDRQFVRMTTLRALFAPFVFLISIPFAFVQPFLAVAVWCLSPLATYLGARMLGRQQRHTRHAPEG